MRQVIQKENVKGEREFATLSYIMCCIINN